MILKLQILSRKETVVWFLSDFFKYSLAESQVLWNLFLHNLNWLVIGCRHLVLQLIFVHSCRHLVIQLTFVIGCRYLGIQLTFVTGCRHLFLIWVIYLLICVLLIILWVMSHDFHVLYIPWFLMFYLFNVIDLF